MNSVSDSTEGSWREPARGQWERSRDGAVSPGFTPLRRRVPAVVEGRKLRPDVRCRLDIW